MKRIITVILALAMTLSLAACASTSSSTASSTAGSTADAKKEILIGYSFANIDENNNRTLKALESYIEETNAARPDLNVSLTYTDSQGSVDKQLSDIEAMILKKPDIIFLSAVDVMGSIPAAQAVAKAGIICVEDRGIEDDSITWHFRSCDEPSISDMIKEWVKKQLDANPDLVLNYGLINGAPAQVLQLIRNDCIKELAKEMPDRVKIIDEKYGNWSTQESQAIVEDWLQAYPEMNAINSASDDMSLGACNALTAAGKINDFIVTSVDGTSIGCQLVEDGKLDMTVKMLPSLQMKDFVDISIKSVEGTFTDKEYNCGTAVLVTVDKDTVAEYKDAA